MDVRIIHTTGSATGIDATPGKRVYVPKGNNDCMIIVKGFSDG